MKVSLIQSVLVWKSKANRNHFEQINAIPNDVDLIVLPEITSGFTMNPAVSETMQGETVTWPNFGESQKLL
jgi:Flp pilus assembly protein TadB